MDLAGDCRICGGLGKYNIFTDELCFDAKGKTKTKIYICLNNFLYEKLYTEDENTSFICQTCCTNLCDSYSFMIFVRNVEKNKWKIEQKESENSSNEDEIVEDPLTCSGDETLDDEYEQKPTPVIDVPEVVSAPTSKKQKLSSELPASIKYTHYELEQLDNNVIVLNVSAANQCPKSGNYEFDDSFLSHQQDNFTYQCKYCIKAFSNSEFLFKHVCNIHLCTLCLEVLQDYKSLNSHMKTHISVNCPFCRSSFNSPATFRQHLKKQHLLKVPAYIGILIK